MSVKENEIKTKVIRIKKLDEKAFENTGSSRICWTMRHWRPGPYFPTVFLRMW